jgi:purine-binding chemotaxis protein CheW
MTQAIERNSGKQSLASLLQQNKTGQQDGDTTEHETKYLSFQLGEEVYGIDILTIKEIIEYDNVCKVPMVPEHIRGVINLRGNVVPVIDMAVRLNCTGNEVSKRSCIVILEMTSDGEAIDIGIVVDAVNEVLDITQKDIEPTPSFGVTIEPEFIEGMGRVNETFVVLLNLNKALDIDELAELNFEEALF